MTALDDARATLYRATEANRSMLRAELLWQASDALADAGFPRWAEIAEAAATRIGGDGQDVRELLFDVDCAVSRALAGREAVRA